MIKIDRWRIPQDQINAEENEKGDVGSNLAVNCQPEEEEPLLLIFEPTADRKQFVVAHDQKMEGPVIVLEGYSIVESNVSESLEEYKKRFFALPLIDIIMANFAQHEQFPKKINSEYEPLLLQELEQSHYSRLRHYRIKADEWKCSLKCKDLFWLTHIYCDLHKAVK